MQVLDGANLVITSEVGHLSPLKVQEWIVQHIKEAGKALRTNDVQKQYPSPVNTRISQQLIAQHEEDKLTLLTKEWS